MFNLNINMQGLWHFGKLSGGYFVTAIINQSMPLLILPILTRYLTPAEYGGLALFTFYFAISKTITGAPIHQVVSKYFFSSDKKSIAEIIGSSIIIVGALSLSALIVIIVMYPYLQYYLNIPLLWLALMPPASFAFIVFSIGLTVLRNLKNVALFGKHQIFNTVINIVISLILIVVLTWSWHGRALGIIISYFISALIVFWYLHKSGYISFAISKNLFNNILRTVIPLIPNSFQLVLISQMGIYFIQYFFTKDLLGLYAIGFQVATVINILVTTLNMSWSPFIYEQISKEKPFNKLYVTRMLYVFMGVICGGVIFINITSGIILRIMTTPDFYGANEFIPWLTVGFMFYGFYILLMPILIKNDKQNYISVVSFISMIVMVFLNYWFIGLFGYIGVAYAFCLTYFFMFIAFFYQAKKVMPLPWVRALKIWN